MIIKTRIKNSARKRYSNKKNVDYFLFITLLLFSGNPVLRPIESYGWCALGLLGLTSVVLEWGNKKEEIVLQKTLLYIIIAAFVVFLGQTIVFEWNTTKDIILFFAKILGGFYIASRLKNNIRYVYLNVIFFISIFSVFFWILWLVKIDIPFLYNYGGGDSFLLFYCRRHGEIIRNCGAFWEPGVFACYILFLLFFWSTDLNVLWKKHKKKCLMIVVALMSTQSTTGYVTFGIFMLFYFLFFLKSRWKYLLFPSFLLFALILYESTAFLKEKVELQNTRAFEAKGDFDSSRLGSFFFDLYYIEKHPFFGNGLHHEMRWADHIWLWNAWKNKEIEKSGCGLSDFIASMGIPFCLYLFFLSYKNNKGVNGKNKLLLFLLLIMLLIGEPLMLYPFILSFPFYKMA